MQQFRIEPNDYLSYPTRGYFHQYYTGYGRPGNPNFINNLKNTFADKSEEVIEDAIDQLKKILVGDLPTIPFPRRGQQSILCMCVPRAKEASFYTSSLQFGFLFAVQTVAKQLNFLENGTECIIRTSNTYTTHLNKPIETYVNDGPRPYKGITKDTCYINKTVVRGRTILLIDDVYTKSVNIDEDCIQALYDCGAKEVVFYAVAYTKRDA